MPKYGIIGMLNVVLAHNLAKYQYFTMTLSLSDKYYYIFSEIFSSISSKIWIVCPKNHQKPQKCLFLDSRFFESVRHVLANNSDCDRYFSIILFLGVTEGNSADTYL